MLASLINMNSNNSIDVFSETQRSIESVESSIQNLIKICYKRLEYRKLFYNISKEQNHQQLMNRAPWRNHLANVLESNTVHAIVMSLLLLDLLLTVLELSSSLLSSCVPIKKEARYYHWVGIAILCLVYVKTVGLAIALGCRAFFRRPGYVIDGVVVTGAIFLEAFLERKGGGLLAIASLWRVVRVVESAFELSDEAIESQIHRILCQFQALRDENIKLLDIIAEKDIIIGKLRQQLDQFSLLPLQQPPN